jgi:hypothetical protein
MLSGDQCFSLFDNIFFLLPSFPLCAYSLSLVARFIHPLSISLLLCLVFCLGIFLLVLTLFLVIPSFWYVDELNFIYSLPHMPRKVGNLKICLVSSHVSCAGEGLTILAPNSSKISYVVTNASPYLTIFFIFLSSSLLCGFSLFLATFFGLPLAIFLVL